MKSYRSISNFLTSTGSLKLHYADFSAFILSLGSMSLPQFESVPREIGFLRRNNEALGRIMNIVEMPDRMAEHLIRFICLNESKLGHKRCEGEFEKLTDDKAASIEAIVHEAFDGCEPTPTSAAWGLHRLF
jgi:hypothetical protein